LLDASHNLFSASLPSLTSDAAAQLRRVVLRGNPISGEVPASWARLWNTTAAPGLCAAAASDDAGVLLDMACTCLHGNISSVLLASTSACIHGVLDLVATRITDCIELQALVEARRGSGGVGEMRVRCAEAGGENGGRVDSYSMTSVRADAGGLTAGNACELVRGVNGTGVVAMVLASVEVTAPLTFVSKYPIRLAVTRHCPLSGGPEEGSGQGAGGVPSGVGCGAVAVTWRTVGGDARKGIDFEEAEGVVRWAEGDTSERHVTVFVHRAAARARVRRFDVELLPAPDSAPAVLARGKERTHVRLSRCTGENSPAVFDRADPHRAGRGGRGACAADLTTVRCGDGVRDIGEACDDGNRAGNDGCSGACQVEAYWWCYGGSLTSTDVCAPMSSQLGVLGPGFKGGTRASLHAVEIAFGWMGVQGLNTSWFMRETYEGHQLYPILLKETERARQTTSSHVYNPSEDYWPAGIFWPNEYWTFTSNPLHWITSLGCADDPYDGSLAHDDDSQATDGHVATGLLALPGVQACGVLAYHKGYSGFCLGRNGRCHTHWTFFDMLERMGGVRSPAAAGAVGHVWQMPAVAGCKVRAGEEAGSDGAMSCYQLRSNPCHSDPEVYLGRASVPQHLPCSPHATCEWDGPGNSARCTCKTGFTGNGYECWLLVDERQCDGFGSAWEDGQCFKLFSSSPRPWLNAEQFCRHNWGGALASIRSEAQSAVVADLMASAGYYAGMKGAWIGLKQPAYIIATGAVTAPDWLPASLAQQTQADLVAGAGAGDGYSRWAEGEEDTFQVRSNYTRCAFVDASGLWHLSEFGGCGEHPGEHPWRTTEYRLPLCARTTPDVDECAAGLDDCDAHATCLHPIRTYNCSCDKGYTGHGRLAELELTNTLLAAYGPGVQFSASFPASPLQLSRLGADVRALPEWLDRPHAILQPEGGREGLKLEVGGIYAEADKVWIEADIGRITPLLSIGWWLYAGDNRSHARMRVEVSVSGDFAGEHILLFKCADFDDCGGPETDAGRRVPAYGIAARYVRIYVGRGSTDSTVRFLRMSLVSARHRGCAPCPILSTFEGAPPGQCVACSGAGGGSGELRRVEGAVVGCGTVAVCDGGKGSLFMGACFRYFGPSLFEVGDTPPAKPGRNASRDGAVTLERAREECRRWGGDLAVVGDRGRMEVVRALLRDQAWVGVRASDGASALKWVDGSLFDAWGGADTWGPPCIGGTRSGDCPAPPPAADEPTQCVLMGLGGVLRSASCSGRTEGGAGQGGSGGDVRVDRGVVRGWVCEKQEAGGVGADVRIELLVRSSSGNADLVDLDPGRLRVSASCGGDNCWCESVSGCACGESGAVLGRVVAGPSKEGSGGGAWRRVSVSIWLVIAKDCFVRVEHTLGRFAAVVLPVSSSLVDAYIGGGEGIVLRMVAIEPVDDVQSKGVRAVLSWGATPPDLDLHIYKDSNASPPGAESCPTCASDGSARVCSAVQPVSWISRSKFGGVALDVDDMMGYGPETVTWDDAAQDGIYHIVVHIYSSGGRWEGSDVQMSISMRNVAGITLVRPAADVLASDCPSATCLDGLCCYWWVGTVTKTQSQYQYFPANAIISKPRQC
jgi:cysteine-rich repeat protein